MNFYSLLLENVAIDRLGNFDDECLFLTNSNTVFVVLFVVSGMKKEGNLS